MRIHLVGIGGAGLSAIARILLERGFLVSGSDRTKNQISDELEYLGAKIAYTHEGENVVDTDMVIRSSAIPDNNVEILKAKSLGIPVYKRADFLNQLIGDKFTIAVSGTHGKTTTTAMISWILHTLNKDPSYIVGGIIKNLGINAHSGEGNIFVIEADEYDYMFLGLNPDLAIVTNIEFDHPDIFTTKDEYVEAFRKFINLVGPKQKALFCGDDQGAANLVQELSAKRDSIRTYGIRSGNLDYSADNILLTPQSGYEYDFCQRGISQAKVELQIAGEHNVMNSIAAMAVIDLLGYSIEEAAKALSQFVGTGRRFELVGEVNNILVIDDYAHHPTEVKATIHAARTYYPARQIWVVWQPHTYSRTTLFFDEFIQSFDEADHLIITDIYAAREKKPTDFSSADLAASIDHPDITYIASLEKTKKKLLTKLSPGDVLLVLSAGDANQVSKAIISSLVSKNPNGSKQIDSQSDLLDHDHSKLIVD